MIKLILTLLASASVAFSQGEPAQRFIPQACGGSATTFHVGSPFHKASFSLQTMGLLKTGSRNGLDSYSTRCGDTIVHVQASRDTVSMIVFVVKQDSMPQALELLAELNIEMRYSYGEPDVKLRHYSMLCDGRMYTIRPFLLTLSSGIFVATSVSLQK